MGGKEEKKTKHEQTMIQREGGTGERAWVVLKIRDCGTGWPGRIPRVGMARGGLTTARLSITSHCPVVAVGAPSF